MNVMNSEPALQHLNELRKHVDDEMGEYVDTLTQLVLLQQDISDPMLGAKVTLWLRPETESYKCPVSEVPDHVSNWQTAYSVDDPEKWEKWKFDWYNGEPGEEPEEVTRLDLKVDGDAPDLVGHEAIVIEGNVAESAPDGELWDPNEEEYRVRQDYPLGTVNCVVGQEYHGEELITFSEGYATDVEVYTSITPADGDPSAHEYTPGWE